MQSPCRIVRRSRYSMKVRVASMQQLVSEGGKHTEKV